MAELEAKSLKTAILAHFVRRMQQNEKCPALDSRIAKTILETGELPTPFEQADNLLRVIAEEVKWPGKTMPIYPEVDQFTIGARSEEGVAFLLESLIDQKLLVVANESKQKMVTPTLMGWQRYDELRRGISNSRRAFMAMQFGDPDLDCIFDTHFRDAVAQAGFYLSRLDDSPKAGSIDDRLRVEIQNARFMIADLTHANNGAYWEAGYAEGLGKPVIYTCRDTEFSKIHFDTGHLLTVKWRIGDEQNSAERLKATIRATLPDAKRFDD